MIRVFDAPAPATMTAGAGKADGCCGAQPCGRAMCRVCRSSAAAPEAARRAPARLELAVAAVSERGPTREGAGNPQPAARVSPVSCVRVWNLLFSDCLPRVHDGRLPLACFELGKEAANADSKALRHWLLSLCECLLGVACHVLRAHQRRGRKILRLRARVNGATPS